MGSSDPYITAVLAEYSTLREESAQARGAQQTTIQWSLATFGAIFAGGLIFLGQAPTLNKLHVTAFIVVFGLGLPWFATFSSWTWWGECRRMERAGLYLRALESHLETIIPDHGRTPPMQWERFIAWGPADVGVRQPDSRIGGVLRARPIKLKIGYIGALGIYLGATAVAVAIAWKITAQHPADVGGWAYLLYANYVAVLIAHISADIVQGLLMLSMPHILIPVAGDRYLTPSAPTSSSQLGTSDAGGVPAMEPHPRIDRNGSLMRQPRVAIVAFSFGQRSEGNEPNPCNMRLATQASDVAASHPNSVIYAQWEIALALRARELACVPLKPATPGYVGSEEVWQEAVRNFGTTHVDRVIPVAQPILQLHKVKNLIKRSGFAVESPPLGWVGFDPSPLNTQWWTKGPVRLLSYAVLQAWHYLVDRPQHRAAH